MCLTCCIMLINIQLFERSVTSFCYTTELAVNQSIVRCPSIRAMQKKGYETEPFIKGKRKTKSFSNYLFFIFAYGVDVAI